MCSASRPGVSQREEILTPARKAIFGSTLIRMSCLRGTTSKGSVERIAGEHTCLLGTSVIHGLRCESPFLAFIVR